MTEGGGEDASGEGIQNLVIGTLSAYFECVMYTTETPRM